MKYSLAVLSLFTFALVATAPAQAAYSKNWYIGNYWSGEWPPGFAVVKKNVRVYGRLGMDKNQPKDVSCLLPYKAVFQPWNGKRTIKSNAKYKTASRIVNLVANDDFEFADGSDTNLVKIPVKKGDVIKHLMYVGEGWFKVKIGKKEYMADQSLFDHVTRPDQGTFLEEPWIRLNCEEGEVAWLMLNDLEKVKGLIAASTGGAGIIDYGTSRDLTDQEVKALGRK